MTLSLRALALTAVAALVAVACSANEERGPGPTAVAPSARASAAAPAGPLRIGVLLPYTEQAVDSDVGASQRRAADLYLDLRGHKLAGRDVDVIYADESVDPGVNKVRIEQLLTQDHVDLLLGGAFEETAGLLRNAADAAKLIYIDTNATTNELTRSIPRCAPTCRSDYVFRAVPDAWQIDEPLGEWCSRNGQKQVYAVYADDLFGREAEAAFADGLARNAGTVSGKLAVAPKSGTDWSKVVTTIKSQSVRAIFAAFVTDDAEGFLAAWAAAGMNAAGYHLYGPGPLADGEVLKQTKQAGLGTITTFPWAPELDSAENQAFVAAFMKAYKDEDTGEALVPDGYAAEMWSAMTVLDRALQATNGDAKSAAALAKALTALTVPTPLGPLAFDPETHGAILDIQVREVTSSGGRLRQTIVEKIPRVSDPAR